MAVKFVEIKKTLLILSNGKYFSGDHIYWDETTDKSIATAMPENAFRSMMWDCWGCDDLRFEDF